jgi:hypothetical protein
MTDGFWPVAVSYLPRAKCGRLKCMIHRGCRAIGYWAEFPESLANEKESGWRQDALDAERRTLLVVDVRPH